MPTIAPGACGFTPLAIAIEVALRSRLVGLFVSALEGDRAFSLGGSFAAPHFGALLLQDGFAR